MCKHFSVARTTFLRGRDNISQCKEITFLDRPRLMTDHLKAPTHLVSPQVLAPHVCITVCALDEFYIYSVKLELATVVPIVKQRGLFGWICVSLLGLVHRMTRAPTIVSFVVDAGRWRPRMRRGPQARDQVTLVFVLESLLHLAWRVPIWPFQWTLVARASTVTFLGTPGDAWMTPSYVTHWHLPPLLTREAENMYFLIELIYFSGVRW